MSRKRDSSSGSSSRTVNFTIRLPKDCGAWMFQLSRETDKSLTELVVGLLDDARTWWGMGGVGAESLKRDAEALSLSQRDYVYYLLTGRYRQVKQMGPGFDKDSEDAVLSQRP
jgi:hypothetical protein